MIVTLPRKAKTNHIFVSVFEEQHGVSFELAVRAADAADAFNHPHAYAAPDQEDDPLAA
jgi:hypothetical protein